MTHPNESGFVKTIVLVVLVMFVLIAQWDGARRLLLPEEEVDSNWIERTQSLAEALTVTPYKTYVKPYTERVISPVSDVYSALVVQDLQSTLSNRIDERARSRPESTNPAL